MSKRSTFEKETFGLTEILTVRKRPSEKDGSYRLYVYTDSERVQPLAQWGNALSLIVESIVRKAVRNGARREDAVAEILDPIFDNLRAAEAAVPDNVTIH